MLSIKYVVTSRSKKIKKIYWQYPIYTHDSKTHPTHPLGGVGTFPISLGSRLLIFNSLGHVAGYSYCRRPTKHRPARIGGWSASASDCYKKRGSTNWRSHGRSDTKLSDECDYLVVPLSSRPVCCWGQRYAPVWHRSVHDGRRQCRSIDDDSDNKR